MNTLHTWYARHGRHDLPWRLSRDPWAVLVSEVMLQQTQVARVLSVWAPFMTRFPTPDAMAAHTAGDVIAAWGTLGYPRRARRLWEAARQIAATGWPPPGELQSLPGVGAYTAAAVAVQALGDTSGYVAEVNIQRVTSRAGPRATAAAAGLSVRDQFLALMDVGALVCAKRAPRCGDCPLFDTCATRGPRPDEPTATQARFAGSFRQRRGVVLAALRGGPTRLEDLDADALASLVDDGLAVVTGRRATLPY